MNTQIVKLSFSAPVHFGSGRLSGSESSCAADTLFSALYIEAMKLGIERELLDAARTDELLISDLFPYIGNTLYLPKPMISAEREPDDDEPPHSSLLKKAYKGLSHIPINAYRDYFSGALDPVRERERLHRLGASALQTKVNLFRENTADAEPYYVGLWSFYDDAGLYFIVRGGYDISPIMDSLQYSGIGGKRSAGYGRFVYERREEESVSAIFGSEAGTEMAGCHLLLASASPGEDELSDALLEDASCKLVRRSGFVQSETYASVPLKKRDFYVFASGSVFAKKFDGGIFDVSAEGTHPVYRYARAMWMEVRR